MEGKSRLQKIRDSSRRSCHFTQAISCSWAEHRCGSTLLRIRAVPRWIAQMMQGRLMKRLPIAWFLADGKHSATMERTIFTIEEIAMKRVLGVTAVLILV